MFNLRMEGSDMTTITYVFDVKMSMKAAKLEFLTSMLWKEAANLLQRGKKSELTPLLCEHLKNKPFIYTAPHV